MSLPSAAGPRVSVVMPVRNESTTIKAAVLSVLEQSLADIELLIVDGASSDDTADQVLAIAEGDPRVRLLNNPERTIPHALNIGLAHAAGRYLARVDAHARVSDTYLECGLHELESSPHVAAVGGRRIGIANTPTGLAVAAALSSPFGVGNSVNHYGIAKQDTDHASFGIYRVDVLRAVRGWDEDLPANEDVDIDHRILALGHGIRYDPDMCIYWQVRETLFDFGRQYRRYGRGKAGMVRKNGVGALRARHLAAPVLVTVLGVAGGLALAGRPRLAAILCTPYAAAVCGVTARSRAGAARDAGAGSNSTDRIGALPLGGAFVTMHVSWGVGFLEGYLLGLAPVASSVR